MGGKVAGNLVIIGGAEDKENECTILKAFINLAGGKDAAIVIMTTATALPEETGARYQDVFGRLGCQSVTVCHVQSRAEAHDPSSCEKRSPPECFSLAGTNFALPAFWAVLPWKKCCLGNTGPEL
jgi:cyanophycinase-like exopeptidase